MNKSDVEDADEAHAKLRLFGNSQDKVKLYRRVGFLPISSAKSLSSLTSEPSYRAYREAGPAGKTEKFPIVRAAEELGLSLNSSTFAETCTCIWSPTLHLTPPNPQPRHFLQSDSKLLASFCQDEAETGRK